MKAIALATPVLLLLGMGAEAEESHSLRGLFCRTEAQIVETFDHMKATLGPNAAVEMTNRDEIVCVYADRIDYVVVRPFIIGQVRHNGVYLVSYEATGILKVGTVAALRTVGHEAAHLRSVRSESKATCLGAR